MLPFHSSILIIILNLSFLISSSTSQLSNNTYVKTFQFVNNGPLNNYGENGSTYRPIIDFLSNDVLGLLLCFYNTTPNAYTLALATYRPQHFVWSANPNHPVKDGATLTLRQDGNLVLADYDGRVVWQTKTSNKGVMSLVARRENSYGNIVLVDVNNNSVWQSFDHPTDTLFSSQFLRASGPKKLVSRVSSSGAVYSMVMMPYRLSLYYKGANSSKPVVYYTLFKTKKTLISLQFHSDSNNKPSFNQSFVDGSNASFEFANLNEESNYDVLGWFIRLENDGNLKIYVYDVQRESWYMGFELFTNGDWPVYETQVNNCQLPEKCGNFGVCYEYECRACPTPKEIVGWTSNCEAPKLGECSVVGKNVTYLKVEGVEHFATNFTKGEGRMVQSLCETKCSMDCKCLGYFYRKESSKCWIVNDLKTLIGSGNVKHSAYVKMFR